MSPLEELVAVTLFVFVAVCIIIRLLGRLLRYQEKCEEEKELKWPEDDDDDDD